MSTSRDNQLVKATQDFEFSRSSTDQSTHIDRNAIVIEIVTNLVRGTQIDDLSPAQEELVELSIAIVDECLVEELRTNDLSRSPRIERDETDRGVYLHAIRVPVTDHSSQYLYI